MSAAAGLGMAYHAAAPASHASQHAILAAAAAAAHNQGMNQSSAAAAAGFYPPNNNSVHHQQPQQQQPHHTNAQQPTQEVQPDRPIGYGAFGVVWWVIISDLIQINTVYNNELLHLLIVFSFYSFCQNGLLDRIFIAMATLKINRDMYFTASTYITLLMFARIFNATSHVLQTGCREWLTMFSNESTWGGESIGWCAWIWMVN